MRSKPSQLKWWRSTLAVIVTVLLILGIRNSFSEMIRANPIEPCDETWQNSQRNVTFSRLRVVKATLQAMPNTYEGPCPVEIKFKASITVSGGKGTVNFIMQRSDNSTSPVTSIYFDKPGDKDTVFYGNANGDFFGWQQIRIVKPNVVESNRVDFSIKCQ